MTAVRSEHRTNAFINRNFIIRVCENPKENSRDRLTSANKLSNFVKDEALVSRIFEKLLASDKDRHTVLIRERLRIDFISK